MVVTPRTGATWNPCEIPLHSGWYRWENEIAMLTSYLQAALRHATYEILADDQSFYGEIPGFQGVLANAQTLEECRQQLAEVLEEWVLVHVARNLDLPAVDGIVLSVKEIV